MRFSQLSITRQLTILVFFLAIMTVIALSARWFANSLPNALLFPLAAGMMAYAAGFLHGDKSATKRLRNGRPPPGL